MIAMLAIFGLFVCAWRGRPRPLTVGCLCVALLLAVLTAPAHADTQYQGKFGCVKHEVSCHTPHLPGLRCVRLPGPFRWCRNDHGHSRKRDHDRRDYHRRSKRWHAHKAAVAHRDQCRRLRALYVARHGAHTPRGLRHVRGCMRYREDRRYHQHHAIPHNPLAGALARAAEEL